MPSHAWDRLITKWGGGHNRLPSWVGLFDNGEGEHLYLILLCCVSFLWSPNRLNLRLFNKFLCGGLKNPPFLSATWTKEYPPAETKGCGWLFWDWASQDYLVGFHQLTILTGQGNVRDLLVVSKGRAAFPKLWHFVSYDMSSLRGPQATTIPDFPHLCQYTIFLCVRMQSLWGDISGSAMGLLLSLKKKKNTVVKIPSSRCNWKLSWQQ